MRLPALLSLENLRCEARIGCADEERCCPQMITFDLKLTYNAAQAALTDEISAALNYAEVVGLIKTILAGREWKLLEAISFDLSRELFRAFPQLEQLELTCRKFRLPEISAAGLTVNLSRSDVELA